MAVDLPSLCIGVGICMCASLDRLELWRGTGQVRGTIIATLREGCGE